MILIIGMNLFIIIISPFRKCASVDLERIILHYCIEIFAISDNSGIAYYLIDNKFIKKKDYKQGILSISIKFC